MWSLVGAPPDGQQRMTSWRSAVHVLGAQVWTGLLASGENGPWRVQGALCRGYEVALEGVAGQGAAAGGRRARWAFIGRRSPGDLLPCGV